LRPCFLRAHAAKHLRRVSEVQGLVQPCPDFRVGSPGAFHLHSGGFQLQAGLGYCGGCTLHHRSPILGTYACACARFCEVCPACTVAANFLAADVESVGEFRGAVSNSGRVKDKGHAPGFKLRGGRAVHRDPSTTAHLNHIRAGDAFVHRVRLGKPLWFARELGTYALKYGRPGLIARSSGFRALGFECQDDRLKCAFCKA